MGSTHKISLISLCLFALTSGSALAVDYSLGKGQNLTTPLRTTTLTPPLSLEGRGGFDIFLVVTPTPFSSVQPRIKLPEEPDEFDEREVEAYYDWRSDMFYRKFDLTGKGSVDYMTARRTYKVWLDDFGTPVVITVADPLFYWIDLNANGVFEQDKGEMWSDPWEDGLTGNEKPYDSSDLQTPPSEIPLWSAPDRITP